MISTTTTIIAAGAVGLFVVYCVYFDRKRRSDPLYKEKLKKSKSIISIVKLLLIRYFFFHRKKRWKEQKTTNCFNQITWFKGFRSYATILHWTSSIGRRSVGSRFVHLSCWFWWIFWHFFLILKANMKMELNTFALLLLFVVSHNNCLEFCNKHFHHKCSNWCFIVYQ